MGDHVMESLLEESKSRVHRILRARTWRSLRNRTEIAQQRVQRSGCKLYF